MSTKDGTIILLGQVPSKKNAKQIVKVRGRLALISSKRHAEWHKYAVEQLKAISNEELQKITEVAKNAKCEISYMFYCKDLRRRDTSNMLESINDLLVDAGILIDDDWSHVRIGWADSDLDRENPRAEITIKPYRRVIS